MTKIKVSDGAGGEAMQALLKERVLKYMLDFQGDADVSLAALDDSGVAEGIVFTTDAHTVRPLFYPGGDIGSLSAAGTINDISVMGARPVALAASLVIEESFKTEDLERIIKSLADTCKEAGVPIITGDTKVVEKGSLDKIVVTTSAIGLTHPALEANNQHMAALGRKQEWLLDSNVCEGDAIIVSGSFGDHGIALLSFREGYGFETELQSDTAALNGLILDAITAKGIAAAKDPTRGGLANTLNEWASKSKTGILVREEDIPIKEAVARASDMLGIDPLQVGNEGKVVLAVEPGSAEKVLVALRAHPLGKDAAIIGHATSEVKGVVLETEVGGRRIMEPPVGDPVPRIC
jgi:hydrogenase expression/formation protein HypE